MLNYENVYAMHVQALGLLCVILSEYYNVTMVEIVYYAKDLTGRKFHRSHSVITAATTVMFINQLQVY